MSKAHTSPDDVPVFVNHDSIFDGAVTDSDEAGNLGDKLSMGFIEGMDREGNVINLATQCGWRHNPTAIAKAAAMQAQDIAMANGFVPRTSCPHTFQFSQRLFGDSAKPRRLVPAVSDGKFVADKDLSTEVMRDLMMCNGESGGCSHWLAEQNRRQKLAREAYDAKYVKPDMVSIENLKQIAAIIRKDAKPYEKSGARE